MIEIDTEIKTRNLTAILLVQIHDELTYEVKEEEVDIAKVNLFYCVMS